MDRPQEIGRRPVEYVRADGTPYSENEARYLDFWLEAGYDLTNPEFGDILEYDPIPEIRGGKYSIN